MMHQSDYFMILVTRGPRNEWRLCVCVCVSDGANSTVAVKHPSEKKMEIHLNGNRGGLTSRYVDAKISFISTFANARIFVKLNRIYLLGFRAAAPPFRCGLTVRIPKMWMANSNGTKQQQWKQHCARKSNSRMENHCGNANTTASIDSRYNGST